MNINTLNSGAITCLSHALILCFHKHCISGPIFDISSLKLLHHFCIPESHTLAHQIHIHKVFFVLI